MFGLTKSFTFQVKDFTGLLCSKTLKTTSFNSVHVSGKSACCQPEGTYELNYNDLPLYHEEQNSSVRKKPQRQRCPVNTWQAADPDSITSEDEKEYHLRLLLVDERRTVNHHPPQRELHSELRAVATEYQPLTQIPVIEEALPREPSFPLLTHKTVQAPARAKPLPLCEEKPRHKAVEDESSQELKVDVVPTPEWERAAMVESHMTCQPRSNTDVPVILYWTSS